MVTFGKKWLCYSCTAKFYDFNKPEVVCPKCKANQKDAPIKIKSPKKEKVALQIEDDFVNENDIDNNNDSLDDGIGISTNAVESVDPGDLPMDDYDE